jgi:excisionase family DNA binding protein
MTAMMGSRFRAEKPIGKLWTPQEVAEYWRVHVGSIWRWIRQGKIPTIPVGREYRIANDFVLSGIPKNLKKDDEDETTVKQGKLW